MAATEQVSRVEAPRDAPLASPRPAPTAAGQAAGDASQFVERRRQPRPQYALPTQTREEQTFVELCRGCGQ